MNIGYLSCWLPSTTRSSKRPSTRCFAPCTHESVMTRESVMTVCLTVRQTFLFCMHAQNVHAKYRSCTSPDACPPTPNTRRLLTGCGAQRLMFGKTLANVFASAFVFAFVCRLFASTSYPVHCLQTPAVCKRLFASFVCEALRALRARPPTLHILTRTRGLA